MNANPYENLPSRNYWRLAIADNDPLDPADIYIKKYHIEIGDKVAAAGSCFAQHITRALRRNGFSILDVEPAPNRLKSEYHLELGYGQYTSRYSNIYTVKQLLQLARESFGIAQSPDPVWERNGRYFDSMRPGVEPEGLSSHEEVLAHRQFHLMNTKKMFEEMDIFIFTFGLTEAWRHRETGWVFPTAPSTIAGTYSSDIYEFVNFTYPEIVEDMKEFINLINLYNKSSKLRYLFTVSPVPLTATFEREHVLSATTYSKSVLRAVAGDFAKKYSNIDYFPSFEIISSIWSSGMFYNSNLRSVTKSGVDLVMKTFLSEHGSCDREAILPIISPGRSASSCEEIEEIACEDALLDAFGGAV